MEKDDFLEKRLLEKKLHLADENPFLNYDALEAACGAIFGNKKAVAYEEFLNMTQHAYQIDLEKYAKLHNFIDSVKLSEYFAYVRTKIEQKISFERRTDRILVIGCGQGRLAEIYITMAKKLGVQEITFNDLIETHIEQTEQKIKDTYNTDGTFADGVKISYLPGDFLTIDVSQMFDAAFLIWYVSSEFLDPSSSEALLTMRNRMYSKINSLLISGGGLIEDIPDPNMDPGFYEIGNFKTSHILSSRGILPGQSQNLLLSNWTSEQTEGFPYQLRYTARNGSDVREKESAGFFLRKSEQLSVPSQSIYGKEIAVTTLEETCNIWEAVRMLNQLLLQTVKFPDGSQIDQKRRKITWWEKSD